MEASEIGGLVAGVAVAIETPEVFDERAHEAAARIGPNRIHSLRQFFHDSPPEPAEAQGKFFGLGEWMENCQDAIFAILYHVGEPAIPMLFGVAFGVYDWTQVKALHTLSRLARAGVRTKEIAHELMINGPDLERASETAVSYLATIGDDSPEVLDFLRGEIGMLVAEGRHVDALGLIESFAVGYPVEAREYAEFLRGVMRGEGLQDRHPLLDGAIISLDAEGKEIGVEWGPSGPPPANLHSIRAGLLLRQLLPDDREALTALERWAREHTDESVREALKEHLSNGGDDR